MDFAILAKNIHQEQIFIRDERQQIHRLNVEVNEEIESTFNLAWVIRNQRYLCDKLNINGNEHLELIDELNQVENTTFIRSIKKFGSNEVYLSQLFQYLRSNPKSVAYLLFFSEKECTTFLDPLCKIILSSVYSHCYFEQDRTAILDLMQELLEIYSNFYKDIRRQMHSKYSAFSLVYRNFCDGLPELKTFYKLTLYQPIMQVLSEDSLFLDIDSQRAAMRFLPKEREKHFGPVNSPEYSDNLVKYKQWTLDRLKVFVSNFIESLKKNIFAFPQSLASLIIRVYTILIEHLEFSKVYAVCIDLIFCFLICPAIQNPDLYGITELQVNHISHYNLLQCAQIVQLLALSKLESFTSTYADVCVLFDKDCLSFVIDHILCIFNNSTILKTPDLTLLPYFLISEFELKLLFEYTKFFLSNSDQSDNPVRVYFEKLPESMVDFAIESYYSNADVLEIILSQKEDFVTNYKPLFTSRNILQIFNEDLSSHMIGMLKENQFTAKLQAKVKICDIENIDTVSKEIDIIFFGGDNLSAQQFDSQPMANHSPNKRFMETTDYLDNWQQAYSEVDCLHVPKYTQPDFSFKDLLLNDSSMNDLKQLEEVFNTNLDNTDLSYEQKHDEHDNQILSKSEPAEQVLIDFNDNTEKVPVKIAENSNKTEQQLNESSLSTLIKLDDSQESTLVNNISTIDRTNTHKKGFFSLQSFKNIKDKVKNISIKESNKPIKKLSLSGSNNSGIFNNDNGDNKVFNFSNEKFDIANVKEKTSEILAKYRSNKVSVDEESALSGQCDQQNTLCNDTGDFLDSAKENTESYIVLMKSKLYKLMSLVDLASTHRSYRFLDLQNKNTFIMFLKILLSQARHMNDVSNSVLILDLIRSTENLQPIDLANLFEEMQTDFKRRHFFHLYLAKSRQQLLYLEQCVKSSEMTLRKEQFITNFIIVSFLVRQLMEKNEHELQQLMSKVAESTVLADEKVALVEQQLQQLTESKECQCLTIVQSELAKQVIERHLIGRIYLSIFYSNGDIDKMRDQILHQQISQLSQRITPQSKLLKIPAKYLCTSPWPSAQAELLLLATHKTARDKVQCIYRCCSHIITLLSTSHNTIPSADDLLPVLIFVVIQANPTSILSTIQYVNTYHSKELVGEEAYYWTQFCSVVEFIKTILNQQQEQ